MASNEIVHHKDENCLNNSPENLEVLTRAEHGVKHRKYEGPRHKLPHRKAYINYYNETTKKIEMTFICEVCKEKVTIKRSKYIKPTTCSKRCTGLKAWKTRNG